MPKLAAFPKGDFDALCAHTKMLEVWLDEAATLPIAGIEMYPDFYPMRSHTEVLKIHAEARQRGLAVPMMCTSPDFTHPNPDHRESQVHQMTFWIECMGATGEGLKTCRVLSGQRRPEVQTEQGIRWVIEGIEALLPIAEQHGVVLVMENHYKDGNWIYPEFAQDMGRFTEIVESIDSPWFGINFDPSNALVAGQDPLEVLQRFRHRIRTMHASDRHLKPGYSLEDTQAYSGCGYPDALEHGVVGTGLIDYDAVFDVLQAEHFSGWISIEDGINGLGDLRRSAEFLNEKLKEYFPSAM